MSENNSNSRQSKMATEPIVPLVLSCSLPLVISLVVQGLYNIVDSFFVARISEQALTATSLASPIQILMVAVSVGTGVGVNSLISRCLGSGEYDEADNVATTGLILSIVSSALFICFGLFFSRSFLLAYTDDPELLEMGHSYLSIVTIFCSGIFLATTGERLLQATGNSFLSMCAQITGAVANCILDPIMIFGYFGLPSMGVTGAAVATVIGQWLAAAISLILNVILNHDIHFVFRGFKLKKETVMGIYKVGAPAMLVQGVTSIQTILLNKMLIGISATAVAFFGVYHKIQSFIMMPVNGLGQGQIPIVGYSYGSKRRDRLMGAFRVTSYICIAFMLIVTVIFEIFAGPILLLFNAGEEMMEIGVFALRVMSSTFAFAAFVVVVGNFFTGMGNGIVNMTCTSIRGLLPLAIIAVVDMVAPLDYIWYAFPVSDIIAFALSIFLFVREYRKNIAKI